MLKNILLQNDKENFDNFSDISFRYFLCILSYQILQIANLKIIYTDSTEAFSKLRSPGFEPYASLAQTNFFVTDLYCVEGYLIAY